MIFAPSVGRDDDSEATPTVFGELECVRQQILEHLLQTFRVGDQAAGEMRIGLNLEGELPVLRLVAERPSHHFQQVGEEDFLAPRPRPCRTRSSRDRECR